MDWTLLAIEPTKDKKAITAAYRARLAVTNPEDRPEEFKALRAAYEEALQLAAADEEAAPRDESPVGLWMERVAALYDDFPARIDPANWTALLADDVCVSLGQRPLAETALLNFLMEHFYLPQEVWRVLDGAFSFTSRRDELCEQYSAEFIDYAVINGVQCTPTLPYDLFIPGKSAADCDAYRRLYHRANQGDLADMPPILDQMDELSERHPYGDALRCRSLVESGDEETVRRGDEGYRELAAAYPDDPILVLNYASRCVFNGDCAAGETLSRHILDLRPEHTQARRLLAEAIARQGRYDEAKDLIYDLMNAAGGNQKTLYEYGQILRTWNERIMAEREERLAAAPEDGENIRELGWCYLQNDRNEDARKLCALPAASEGDPYDIHNLFCKVYFSCGDYETSLTHLQALEALLRDLPDDGTDKTARRRRKLPEFLQLQGSCLIELGRSEEATAKYEQALALAPESPDVLTNTGRLLLSRKEYERAADVLQKLTGILPNAYHGHFLLAHAYYALRRDREAFESISRALELEGGDLHVYILKMRILLRNGAWDAVHEVLDLLRQNNITDETNTLWCEAQLVELEENDHPRALGLYRALAERLEKGESVDWGADLYYHIVVLTAEDRDCREEKDRHELLELLEKGLAQDPEDFNCREYKAWLLKRDKCYDEALALYRELEKAPRHPLAIEQELAELYYRDLSRSAETALHYYDLLLEREENGDLHFYAGTCCRYLHRYEDAERHFLREQELAPEDSDGYKGLSFVYEYMGDYERALGQLEEQIRCLGENIERPAPLFLRRVRLLRRLARPDDALAAVDEYVRRCPDRSPYRLKFEILAQFGLWDRAEIFLHEWKKLGADAKGLSFCEQKLSALRGKSPSLGLGAKRRLTPEDYDELRLLLADYGGDYRTAIRIWDERLRKSPEDTYALLGLAEHYTRDSKPEAARDYARRALPLFDGLIADNPGYEALYRSRRAMVLAILGRTEEAAAELAAVRALPLCETCDYGRCKDADLFEAQFAELAGDFERARELCRAGMENWPDETAFAFALNRLKKKGS